MSVDFFPCGGCGESICDCGDYILCNDRCGMRFCTMECGGVQGDDKGEHTCKYCRLEEITDADLLDLLLVRVNLSRKEAAKEFLAAQKVLRKHLSSVKKRAGQ